VKGGHSYVASYQLNPDAPDDSLEIISEKLVVPRLEKVFANGSLQE
jgi:hypothetical protein